MVAILSLLVILSFSILITRIATVVLVHTGLSREVARFQARSAFTGVGFTTAEAETVIRHPLRRRVTFTLMLLGNAGFVTAISSLVLGFIRPYDGSALWFRVLFLMGGVVLLFVVAKSGWVDVHLSRLIIWFLRRYTNVDLKDYASVLHLAAGYEVSEVTVRQNDWLTGKRLYESGLREEGINVLGIQRS
ncbi:MAG: potassium transporter TrkA, partial [Chitinivibrionales bacterium]|nr:potassium transporter TrkA [Chitinivibrionales bacterium]MBD3357593.1 potassium transporter TrkA [Chitinivibrionales bacterium]